MKPIGGGVLLEGGQDLAIARSAADFTGSYLTERRLEYPAQAYDLFQARVDSLISTLAGLSLLRAGQGVEINYRINNGTTPKAEWLLSCLEVVAVHHPDDTEAAAALTMLEEYEEASDRVTDKPLARAA